MTELIEGQVLTHISDCHVLVIQVLLLVMVTDDITQVPQDPIYLIFLSYVQEEQAEEEEGEGGRGEARLNYDEFIISRRLTIMMLMLMLMLVMTMMMTKIQHSSNTR